MSTAICATFAASALALAAPTLALAASTLALAPPAFRDAAHNAFWLVLDASPDRLSVLGWQRLPGC